MPEGKSSPILFVKDGKGVEKGTKVVRVNGLSVVLLHSSYAFEFFKIAGYEEAQCWKGALI